MLPIGKKVEIDELPWLTFEQSDKLQHLKNTFTLVLSATNEQVVTVLGCQSTARFYLLPTEA